jgi:hypothetical protein
VDDQDDRGYSRAPELEDLLSLCKALNAEGVRYLLIKIVDGVPIPVGRKELLIETKQTVRPSDAADVQFLRLRIAAERDRSSI